MNTENYVGWEATPVIEWWDTPSRRLGVIVSIGLSILALLVGALGPNDTLILLGAIGGFVVAIFITLFLLLLDKTPIKTRWRYGFFFGRHVRVARYGYGAHLVSTRKRDRRTMMGAKCLILALALTLVGAAAVAAIEYGHVELAKHAPVVEGSVKVLPRVVESAERSEATDPPVTRIVVVGHRIDPN